MSNPPFLSHKKLFVICPTDFAGIEPAIAEKLRNIPLLIDENITSLQNELGCEIIINGHPNSFAAKWYIGPRMCNPQLQMIKKDESAEPELILDKEKGILICDAPNPLAIFETFSYLRSLTYLNEPKLKINYCQSNNEIAERIYQELKISFPFQAKEKNCELLYHKYRNQLIQDANPIPIAQQWLAELNDAHTCVRPTPPQGELPYTLWINNNNAYFSNVPEGSIGWKKGIRNGYQLITDEISSLWDRTASTPHQKPFLVGRRLLSKPIGTIQQLTAQSPTGKILEWDEMTQIKLYDPVVSWRKLKSGNGYLKITAWLRGKNIDKLLDQAFKELSCCNTLIVDLRNNPGGDLFLAHSFRNRFISESRTVGYIMQTLPDGSMSEKESIMAKPAAIEKRWRKPVRFLTDPLTYSASEDMLLGLQGQENIEIVGEPSGGGSGRVRLIRLIPGWILTISTAITSDIYGNCIEGRGIPVDTLVVPDRANSGNLDIVLSKADKN